MNNDELEALFCWSVGTQLYTLDGQYSGIVQKIVTIGVDRYYVLYDGYDIKTFMEAELCDRIDWELREPEESKPGFFARLLMFCQESYQPAIEHTAALAFMLIR